MAQFIGLNVLRHDWGVIELDTPEGGIDLHNNAVFREARYNPAQSTITFEFGYSTEWRAVPYGADFVVLLRFGGVRHLAIHQDDNFDPRAADSFEGIGYQELAGESWFTLHVGDSTFEFMAEELVLSRMPIGDIRAGGS